MINIKDGKYSPSTCDQEELANPYTPNDGAITEVKVISWMASILIYFKHLSSYSFVKLSSLISIFSIMPQPLNRKKILILGPNHADEEMLVDCQKRHKRTHELKELMNGGIIALKGRTSNNTKRDLV